jgi:CDP-diacylglycerol---glycerol-3-phosphate 3-phosphatidyltransferase
MRIALLGPRCIAKRVLPQILKSKRPDVPGIATSGRLPYGQDSCRSGCSKAAGKGFQGLCVTFTTPNLLTLFRLAMVPVLVYLLMFTGPVASAIAAGVFFLATVSDFLDGYIARSYGLGTMLGKFLDPLADKLVVISVLIMLAAMPRFPRVPAWMVVVIVAREVMVTGLRAILAAADGRVMEAEELGKYKMTLQAISIQALLIHYVYFHVDFFAAGMFILWIALTMSIWSGADYFLKAARELSARRGAIVKRAAI